MGVCECGMFGMQHGIASAIQTLIFVEDGWLEYKGIVITFTEDWLKNINYPYSNNLF